MQWLIVLVVAGVIAFQCSNQTPKHYYVLCEHNDIDGWRLVETEEKNGYLIACSYQSPDQQMLRTLRCNSEGCD